MHVYKFDSADKVIFYSPRELHPIYRMSCIPPTIMDAGNRNKYRENIVYWYLWKMLLINNSRGLHFMNHRSNVSKKYKSHLHKQQMLMKPNHPLYSVY